MPTPIKMNGIQNIDPRGNKIREIIRQYESMEIPVRVAEQLLLALDIPDNEVRSMLFGWRA
jgi:hypothetical protein